LTSRPRRPRFSNDVSFCELAADQVEKRMGNSGVGMLLGDVSATALWLWFIGAFILGAAILYGVLRTGRLRRSERAQLDRNAEAAQSRYDPQKRAAAENKSRPF
jgi:hypothetical protein